MSTFNFARPIVAIRAARCSTVQSRRLPASPCAFGVLSIGLRGIWPRGPIAKFARPDTFSRLMVNICGFSASFPPPSVPAWTVL